MPPHDDPRLGPALDDTVNGRLLNRAIRHAIYLYRVGSYERSQIVGFIARDVLPDLYGEATRRIERLKARGLSSDFTSRRFRALITALGGIVNEGLKSARQTLQSDLRELAAVEAKWQRKVLDASLGAASALIETEIPSSALLATLATSRPVVRGRSIPDAFKRLGSSWITEAESVIKLGMIEGLTTQQIVSRLRPIGEQFGSRGLEGLVRTATNGVATNARHLVYAENSDILDSWTFVATLDDRTTIICAGLDGKTFPIGRGPIPPRHFNCRSADVPNTKSWQELGLPFKEIDEYTRVSMNGRVPGKITYPQWLRQQPRDVQIEVLGRTRAEVFRRGNLTIERFTDPRGRILRIPELLALEADVLGR